MPRSQKVFCYVGADERRVVQDRRFMDGGFILILKDSERFCKIPEDAYSFFKIPRDS